MSTRYRDILPNLQQVPKLDVEPWLEPLPEIKATNPAAWIVPHLFTVVMRWELTGPEEVQVFSDPENAQEAYETYARQDLAENWRILITKVGSDWISPFADKIFESFYDAEIARDKTLEFSDFMGEYWLETASYNDVLIAYSLWKEHSGLAHRWILVTAVKED
jgi:hypothetical protein